MPSLLDLSVCPEAHVIHVYSSGGEPYEPWEKLTPGSPEYEAYKEDRAQVLKAVERAIRERAEFHIIGSPLAHEARRDRGTYGYGRRGRRRRTRPAKYLLPFPFPDLKTPVDGLLRCGDSCFPGIGTLSAAASGVIAANTMTDVGSHIEMLRVSRKDPMYKFPTPASRRHIQAARAGAHAVDGAALAGGGRRRRRRVGATTGAAVAFETESERERTRERQAWRRPYAAGQS